MKRLSLLITLVSLVALAGCSKPPEAEISAANAAVDHARSAEAEMYVADAWKMAMDTLNSAMAMKSEQDEKFALFRSYTDAKAKFDRAKALADQAATQAETEKQRVKDEVAGMMTQADSLVTATAEALAKAPRGKGNKADLDLIASDLEGVKSIVAAAKADWDAGKYLASKSKVQEVMTRAQTIMGEIAAAAAAKAGR